MWVTFRYYLERRQVGDAEVRAFVEECDPALLDSTGWAEAMRQLTETAAGPDYIMQVRQLWQDFARTNIQMNIR
jgi:hypothetical protein